MTEERTVPVEVGRLAKLESDEFILAKLLENNFVDWDDIESVLDKYKATEEEIKAGFICLDCSVHTDEIGEYYMIDFDLWNQIHPANKGMLCIGCVEERLGRQLRAKDFIDALINQVGGMFQQSDRLIDRLNAIQ